MCELRKDHYDCKFSRRTSLSHGIRVKSDEGETDEGPDPICGRYGQSGLRRRDPSLVFGPIGFGLSGKLAERGRKMKAAQPIGPKRWPAHVANESANFPPPTQAMRIIEILWDQRPREMN